MTATLWATTAPGADPLHVVPRDPAPVVPARLAHLRDQLPPRDLAVLADLAALRLMTARQIERLRFGEGSPLTSARRARRALARLHRHGLISHLDRRVGGPHGGSESTVYQLAPSGRRLLGIGGPRGGRRRHLPPTTPHHTAHALTVTELAVTLHEAHRRGTLELLRFESEPACWRTWTGPAGEPHHIRPDAFTITAKGAWEHLAFIEIDLDTEHAPVLQRKNTTYRTYALSGHEQDRWNVFPRVVYLTTSIARRDVIATALQAMPDGADLVTVSHINDALTTLTPNQNDEQ